MLINNVLYDATYISDLVYDMLTAAGEIATEEQVNATRHFLSTSDYLDDIANAALNKGQNIPGVIFDFHVYNKPHYNC